MQAVILAAGRGKRMGKLTEKVPKSMLRVAGRPILEHKVRSLPKSIKEIVFVVGYCSEEIMNHFGHEFDGKRITYVFQPILNGTGGALHAAKSFLGKKFLVMMGDDLYHKRDIQKMIKNDLAVLAKEVDELGSFGILRTDRRGNLIDIVENPKRCKERLANAAVYVLDGRFFEEDLVPVEKGKFGLPQTLCQMAKKHKIKIEKASAWHPINTAKDLLLAEEMIGKFS